MSQDDLQVIKFMLVPPAVYFLRTEGVILLPEVCCLAKNTILQTNFGQIGGILPEITKEANSKKIQCEKTCND
ncbi:hypothetical protein [Tolumonas lignilytica]|uniref:hypothetical protein n=1 Tax=Tolumonas lignilytica TaxID=1283284 RepID=UPI000463E854|nr:hypothetical protein [Tolumonas lignilytica]